MPLKLIITLQVNDDCPCLASDTGNDCFHGCEMFNFSFLRHQAEPEGFSHFHLYVCAAFLVRWRKEILEERDFQVKCVFLSVFRALVSTHSYSFYTQLAVQMMIYCFSFISM